MNFVFVYLIHRFFYRIWEFFSHWYFKGSWEFFSAWRRWFRFIDSQFSFRITLRYFFQPLYGDYTFTGRVLGFVFRFFRVFFASLFFLLGSLFFLAGYLFWILMPVYFLFRAFLG